MAIFSFTSLLLSSPYPACLAPACVGVACFFLLVKSCSPMPSKIDGGMGLVDRLTPHWSWWSQLLQLSPRYGRDDAGITPMYQICWVARPESHTNRRRGALVISLSLAYQTPFASAQWPSSPWLFFLDLVPESRRAWGKKLGTLLFLFFPSSTWLPW